MVYKYTCTKKSILKEYLKELGLSKKFLKKVKLYGKFYINNVEVKNYFVVNENDEITLELKEDENTNIMYNDKPIDVCYEDCNILVINKEHNLSSQPSRKHLSDNLVSMIKTYFQKNNIESNVHIVNRLDYQTSGLMVVSKNGFTHFQLTKDKFIAKKYFAIIEGIIEKKEGIIDLPIKRIDDNNSESRSIKRIVASDGKRAITKYKVIKENEVLNRSLVDVELITGRTHQIRVHFQALGHPLVGDKIYGREDERLYLHCYYLSFLHPFTKEIVEVKKIPDFINII